MNTLFIYLYSAAIHYFALKRRAAALEASISLFLHAYTKYPEQLYGQLCRYSDDSRWVLRYLAGRELGRFLPVDIEEVMRIWFKLAGDENLYVREGTAKGIALAAECSFETVWNLWEPAFDHSSELVRHTAAMTLISFLEKYHGREELMAMLKKLNMDPSAKVKSIYEHYLACYLAGDNDAVKATDDYQTTEQLQVSSRIIDQVVGQEHAVRIIKLAARQRRSVLLIGEPGTGKSMLGQAIAELLEVVAIEDMILEADDQQRNIPKLRSMTAGEGEKYIRKRIKEAQASVKTFYWVIGFSYFVTLFVSLFYYFTRDNPVYLMGGAVAGVILYMLVKSMKSKPLASIPKLLIKGSTHNRAPFVDATGLHAGALLGDVRHDPYQSGGLESFSHHLVEPGAIHLAHKGVLFIDEVSALSMESQQALLTAFQEKKLAITGRSQGSSGRMIRTEPVPCDFVLVLAGNVSDLDKIHPALRSRIQGYGYEVYMNASMEDSEHNRHKIARFIALEVRKDGKIPHFTREAVEEVIAKAKEKSLHPRRFTACFRVLGGIIRAAGDLAAADRSQFVHRKHVHEASQLSSSIEEQMSRKAEA